jgi:hypothetical protein
MISSSMHIRFVSLAPACIAIAFAFFAASPAQAQMARVAVLKLANDEVGDRFAIDLAEALRKAVSQDGRYELSDAKASLDQLSMANDCDSTSDSCLVDITSALAVDGVVYGVLSRAEANGVAVEMSFFDVRGNAKTRHGKATFSSEKPTAAELDDKAAALIQAMFGFAGATPTMPTAPAIAAQNQSDPNQTQPNVRPSDSDIEGPTEASSGGISTRHLVGYGLLGVAAVSVGLSALSFVQIDRAEGNAAFDGYRRAVGKMDPTVKDVCAEADAGKRYMVDEKSFGIVQDKCSSGSTFEVLQYVFIGTALVSGGVSAYLLLGDDDSNKDTARASRGTLAVRPMVSRKSAGLSARMRF